MYSSCGCWWTQKIQVQRPLDYHEGWKEHTFFLLVFGEHVFTDADSDAVQSISSKQMKIEPAMISVVENTIPSEMLDQNIDFYLISWPKQGVKLQSFL